MKPKMRVCQFVQAQPETYVLQAFKQEDGTLAFNRLPVIAWAMIEREGEFEFLDSYQTAPVCNHISIPYGACPVLYPNGIVEEYAYFGRGTLAEYHDHLLANPESLIEIG